MHLKCHLQNRSHWFNYHCVKSVLCQNRMMTSSNGNIFRVTAHLRGNHRSLMNSPDRGQWREALMFSLICAWTNSWVNNGEAGYFRRHCAHYDVTVMGWQGTTLHPCVAVVGVPGFEDSEESDMHGMNSFINKLFLLICSQCLFFAYMLVEFLLSMASTARRLNNSLCSWVTLTVVIIYYLYGNLSF